MARHLNQFKNFYHDKNKKPYLKVLSEFLTLWREGGKFPLHYFTRYAYRKDAGCFRDYVEIQLAKKIWCCETLHDKQCCALLRDKQDFAEFVHKHGLSTPRVVASNRLVAFEVEKQEYTVDSFVEFKKFIIDRIGRDIFIKPTDGMQGRNCFKVEIKKTTDDYLKAAYEKIKEGLYLFQELIVQHPAISQINSSSINTLRIDTYRDNDGKVHILTPFIRLGKGNSITDNTSSDGFIVPVDLEKGVFHDFGIQYLSVGTDFLYEHPDSKVKFKGLKVPFSAEIIKLVTEIASLVEDRLVGWDVAIGVDGPLLVEGNCDYAMAGQDIIAKGYKRHPIFKKMLKEHGFLS